MRSSIASLHQEFEIETLRVSSDITRHEYATHPWLPTRLCEEISKQRCPATFGIGADADSVIYDG
jgi:hypothetical protein